MIWNLLSGQFSSGKKNPSCTIEILHEKNFLSYRVKTMLLTVWRAVPSASAAVLGRRDGEKGTLSERLWAGNLSRGFCQWRVLPGGCSGQNCSAKYSFLQKKFSLFSFLFFFFFLPLYPDSGHLKILCSFPQQWIYTFWPVLILYFLV